MASEGAPIWFDTIGTPKLTRRQSEPSDKPLTLSDQERAALARNRQAYDEELDNIRARSGESYSDRMKNSGGAAVRAAARQEDLE